MDLSLVISGWNWEEVHPVPQGTPLVRGRDLFNTALIRAARDIPYQCGCYSWQSSDPVFYCGLFTKSLQNRIRYYLHKHKGMTNINVFEHLSEEIERTSLSLCLFKFETLRINGLATDFETFSKDRDCARMVEQFLIYTYKKQGQCVWNLV